MAMRDMVESFGYRVATAASGVEFLRLDSLHKSACLITDVRMPGITGFELHERLIAQGIIIPTVFLTAFPDEIGKNRAMEIEAAAYLSKPCKRDDLLALIRSVLPRGFRRT
jgi:FixJ family two-component response regulator